LEDTNRRLVIRDELFERDELLTVLSESGGML
jgi:hypothetical protein